MIIIIRFGENNVLCLRHIYIYEFGGNIDVHIPLYIFHLLLKKMEKSTKVQVYFKSIKIIFYMILI